MRKLTITVSEDVYQGLYEKVGPGKISRFLNTLAKSHLIDEEIEAGYRAMAMDEARERGASELSESLVTEALDETR